MLKVSKSLLAASKTTGSKSKGGTAKTAIKTGVSLKADTAVLPPFLPFQKTSKLKHIKSTLLKPSPTSYRPTEILTSFIDSDLLARYDKKEYIKLFTDVNHLIPLGSVIMVDYVSSLTQPRMQSFAGILIAINKCGVATNFTVRHLVLKTPVEIKFPVLSPLITKITLLKRAIGDPKDFNVELVRNDSSKLEIGFGRVDEMAMRERENLKRIGKTSGDQIQE